jgi:hypothetical protein
VNNSVVNEDSVMNYNKWVQGIASREFNAQKVFLRDILGKTNETQQYPNNVVNNNVLPYPLANLIPSLGTVISNLSIALNLVKNSNSYPLFREDSNNTKNLQDALKNLEDASNSINKAVNNLDNLKITVKIN